jgi:hypothetical protein
MPGQRYSQHGVTGVDEMLQPRHYRLWDATSTEEGRGVHQLWLIREEMMGGYRSIILHMVLCVLDVWVPCTASRDITSAVYLQKGI